MSTLHTKFAAVLRQAVEQFLRAAENRVKFLILHEGTVRLILSINEGQNLDPIKS